MARMKSILTAVVLAGFLAPAIAQAGVRVYVKVRPPVQPKTLRVHVHKPQPGAVRISGHWQWNGHKYVWIDGYWTKPRQGYVYVPGRWKHNKHGWYWISGHWKRVR